MKLVKMSLAAIVAAGAMTTIANATPLEEAIKGVDASGYLRYRYTNTHVDKGDTNAGYEFKGAITFKTPVQDNFQSVLTLAAKSEDGSGSDGGAYTDVKSPFEVKQFYGAYSVGGFTALFGKQTLGTYFTDDMKGTGLKVLFTGVPDWTFAGVAFDALQKDGDIALGAVDLIASKNLYGVAAIGAVGPVAVQAWAASVTDIGEMYAIDVQPSFDFDGFKLGLVGQFGMFDADKDLKAANITDGQLFVLAASAGIAGFDLMAGYVNFEADDLNGKSAKSTVAVEDNGQFAKPGEQLLAYNDIHGENEGFFVTAGYTMAGFNLAAEGIFAENKADGKKVKANEYVGRVGYDVNKQLSLSSWYSYVDVDKGNDADKLRFEAKYSF